MNSRFIISGVAVVLAAAVFVFALLRTPDAQSGQTAAYDDVSSNGEGNVTFEVGDAPKLPPKVAIDVTTDASDADLAGDLAYYSWAFDNGFRTVEPTPPIEWPKAISVEGNGNATLDLKTAVMPQQLDVLLHESVNRDGVPEEENLKPLSCVSGVVEGGANCELGKTRDREGDWNVSFPVQSCSEMCYVVVYASWMLREEVRNDEGVLVAENSASWFFTISPRRS